MVFLAVDGNSIINRAFYGIKTLTTRDGHFTNAVYGFFNIFLNLIDTYKPDACAVAFDVHQPTFRHKMYAEYKAGRRPAPPELVEQFPEIKELLDALGYARIECP
ncbi:MAG: DNA polymerase I, partial [Clostridia bacterium]|nr:DNA polymerase I [Clostridia bacterium]